jgi:hypothetical protein
VNEELLDRYAEMIVGFGANVQPDQVVAVEAAPEAAPLVHRIVRLAYERGARYVDVAYFDPLAKRIRNEAAAEDSLSWVPPWLGRRMLDLGELDAARIVLSPIVPPGLLDGIDPARAGRDRLPSVPEILKLIDDRSVAWTISPFPTEAWARAVFPELEPTAGRSMRSGGIWSTSAGSTSPTRSLPGGAASRRSGRRPPVSTSSGSTPCGSSGLGPTSPSACCPARALRRKAGARRRAPVSVTCRTCRRRSSSRRRIPSERRAT